MFMMVKDKYTLEQLCKLIDVSRRTIRYYIQQGIVDRPEGEKRGSYYTAVHLEQLLEIRKWQRAGLTLDRIKQLLTTDPAAQNHPPIGAKQTGEVSIWSRVYIDDGLELQIDANKAEMTPEELREFVTEVCTLYRKVRDKK